MNDAFFAGALAAWAVTYCSVALLFMLANLWARREREYLLFGLFVLSLAVLNAGVALVFQPDGAPPGLVGNRVAVSGGVFAALFQLQFALHFSGRARPAWLWSSAVIAAGLLVWTWTVLWDVPPAPEGAPAKFLRLAPLLGVAFSSVTIISLGVTMSLLGLSWRRGRVEALLLLGAAAVVGAAALHDLYVIYDQRRRASELLSPFVLWIYVVAMAATLLLRYRGAEGRLAETASSLRARTEELRRSHAELEKIQSELVRKEQLAAVGELAASIAHEVRNPLAVIVNANAGLRRRTLSEEDRETLLSIIEEETERLNRLVAELLRFARPVAAKRALVSLVELCQDVRKSAPPGYSVSVAVPDDPSLETVWVDPGLFRVVLDNLVSNACQATPQGGTVLLSVRRDTFDDGREAVAIDVVDRGHGMEPPILQRAMHPFFTTRPSGTGLGLPIVQRIVEAHGGDLRLLSQPGSGTTATLRVPRARPNSSRPPDPRYTLGHSSSEEPVET
jgi:signal transduction histidine kinase